MVDDIYLLLHTLSQGAFDSSHLHADKALADFSETFVQATTINADLPFTLYSIYLSFYHSASFFILKKKNKVCQVMFSQSIVQMSSSI
jgi:hypothetical protein